MSLKSRFYYCLFPAAALVFFSFHTFLLSFSAFAEESNAETAKSRALDDVPIVASFDKILPEVDVVADQLEYDRQENKIIAKGNVVISHEDIKLSANYAEVYTQTKEAYAHGHVLIFQSGSLIGEGKNAYYNFSNHSGSFPHGTYHAVPWFVTGDEIDRVRPGVTHITNARITTCDYEDPHYDVRASKAIVKAEDKVIAWNVKIYALDKPIFWWPYLVIPLQQNNVPLQISVGKSDEDGYYIETIKGYSITERIWGDLLNDWRSKRGYGGGATLEYDFGNLGRGYLIGYAAWDQDAPDPTPAVSDNPFDEDEREERTRGRISWRHRTNLSLHKFLVLRYHKVSDEFLLQDFFEKEHRSSIEPESFVTLTNNSENFGSYVHVQKRVNDFESLVQKLPEIRFDWKNQPFFIPGLYYENQSSFANLSKKFKRSSMDEDVTRFDSFHEWMYPIRWKEIKLTPYTNMRGTYYSRERRDSNDRFRFAAGYGVDLRTQAYKYFDVTSNKFGIEINKLRHVIEPSFRYDAIRMSTVSDEELNRFDNVDLVDNRDVFTFGLENRIQTKRVVHGQMRRVDIVSLNTFLRYELKPDEPRSSSQFKELLQEVVIRPYSWLQYEGRVSIDPEIGEVAELTQDLILRKDKYYFLFGHRYVDTESLSSTIGQIDTSHLFVMGASYELNPLWTFHGHIQWDAEEQELEEWQIGARRDLHDFILEFGYTVRNSSIRSNNAEVYFNFYMKHFPSLTLRSGTGRATFAEPKIGETVDGANIYGGRENPFEVNVAAY